MMDFLKVSRRILTMTQLKFLKIKVGGSLNDDLDRLQRIAAVLYRDDQRLASPWMGTSNTRISKASWSWSSGRLRHQH